MKRKYIIERKICNRGRKNHILRKGYITGRRKYSRRRRKVKRRIKHMIGRRKYTTGRRKYSTGRSKYGTERKKKKPQKLIKVYRPTKLKNADLFVCSAKKMAE